MKTTITTIAAILMVGSITPFASAEQIPSWVKTNAGWWADGTITESDFVQGIQFLVKEGIIVVPPTEVSGERSQNVPEWVKTNAGWWADNAISDSDFVQGIQFMIKSGLISLGSEQSEKQNTSSNSDKDLLETELEKCQEIKKAYDRLNCEKEVKHKMLIAEFRENSDVYEIGPAKFYFPEPNLEIRDSGSAYLTIDVLVENTGDSKLELMCSGPSVCNYDVWNGVKAYKYSSTDFTSGLLVIKPGESRTFNMFFGPNIGYGGTEFEYDSSKEYVFRVNEPWGSATIPLNLS
ncbi:MAG: peptidase [Candidatus Nitrosomaritimum yanchengensis]